MATRQILADLTPAIGQKLGCVVQVTSIGGVDAARRIRAGAPFDVVLLASDAIAGLAHDGFVLSDTIRSFATSTTAVAVPRGRTQPKAWNEAAIKDLILAAKKVALSTGPSGTSITTLLAQWGMHRAEMPEIVLAPPGLPVAKLLADGEADVGFQQLSELLGQPGIDIIGTLPETLLSSTIFSCGVCTGTTASAMAQSVVTALAAAESEAALQRNGMTRATH